MGVRGPQIRRDRIVEEGMESASKTGSAISILLVNSLMYVNVRPDQVQLIPSQS